MGKLPKGLPTTKSAMGRGGGPKVSVRKVDPGPKHGTLGKGMSSPKHGMGKATKKY